MFLDLHCFEFIRYRSQEIEIFEDQLEAKAKAKAEDVVTQWFSQPRTKLDWDKIAVINDKVELECIRFLTRFD